MEEGPGGSSSLGAPRWVSPFDLPDALWMRRIPEIPMKLVPAVTSAEMAAVDQAIVEDYGIDLIQMMENAGRALAALARDRFLDGDPQGKIVVILAGPGGNGGGALVAGRRLHGWGATIRTVLAHEPDRCAPVSAKQLAILHRLGVEVVSSEQLVATASPLQRSCAGERGDRGRRLQTNVFQAVTRGPRKPHPPCRC